MKWPLRRKRFIRVETRGCWAVGVENEGLVDLDGRHKLRTVCMVEYEMVEYERFDGEQTTSEQATSERALLRQ